MKLLSLRLCMAIAFCLLCQDTLAQKPVITPDVYKYGSLPDSMKENAHSVIRYQHRDIMVKDAGKAIIKEHLIQTILGEEHEDEAVLTLFYERKFSEITHVEMRVYDKEGTLIKKFKKSDFYDRSAVDDVSLITDSRLLVAGHTVVNYPVTVEKIYEISLSSFIDLPDWQIQREEIAVQQTSCQIQSRLSLGFRYQLKNFNRLPVKTSDEEFERYSWNVNNLKAVKPELDSKAWSFLPRIAFATNLFNYDNYPGEMTSWKAYGTWQWNLNKTVDGLPTNRIAEIQKMVAHLQTEKEKARFLYEYLQKSTRYVSIQLGIGGLRPFSAQFVDDKKYGDCKALSYYMQALLKSVNIPSYYTIVRAGMNEEPADPQFVNDPFNHVILCIPFENDTTWLECTSSTNSFGKLGPFTENRNALIITENGGKLVNTPKSIPEDHTFESKVDIILRSNGNASMQFVIEAAGEFRDILLGVSKEKLDDQKQFLIRYLNMKQPDIFDLNLISDENGRKKIQLELEYSKLNDMASGGKLFYRPAAFDIWKLTIPAQENRTTNYYFDHPMKKVSTTIFHLPKEMELESMPVGTSSKFKFGTYSTSFLYDKEKNEVKSVTIFELYSHSIPPTAYKEMQIFMDDIQKFANKKLVLKKRIESAKI